MLAGIDKTELLRAVKLAVEMNENSDFGVPVADYTDESVSGRVVKSFSHIPALLTRWCGENPEFDARIDFPLKFYI